MIARLLALVLFVSCVVVVVIGIPWAVAEAPALIVVAAGLMIVALSRTSSKRAR